VIAIAKKAISHAKPRSRLARALLDGSADRNDGRNYAAADVPSPLTASIILTKTAVASP
jgi:hypothetical protein